MSIWFRNLCGCVTLSLSLYLDSNEKPKRFGRNLILLLAALFRFLSPCIGQDKSRLPRFHGKHLKSAPKLLRQSGNPFAGANRIEINASFCIESRALSSVCRILDSIRIRIRISILYAAAGLLLLLLLLLEVNCASLGPQTNLIKLTIAICFVCVLGGGMLCGCVG